jgi:hypothetical protein
MMHGAMNVKREIYGIEKSRILSSVAVITENLGVVSVYLILHKGNFRPTNLRCGK